MKRFLIPALFFLLFVPWLISSAQIKRVPASDAQAQTSSASASSVLAATFEKRQAVILKGIDEGLKILSDAKKSVQSSESLNAEQKSELMKVIENVEKTLTDYQKAVTAATDSSGLMAANKAFLMQMKENKSQIQQSVAVVIMIGIEEVIDATEMYLITAEGIAKGLEVCDVDTTDIQNDIDTAYRMLADLEALFNQIMADGKVSKDEYDDMKKAVKMSAQLTKLTAQITADLTDAAAKCPYLNEEPQS